MGKSLVIVESPSKASIINRYLGEDYVVRASVGHIRDLSSGDAPKVVDKNGKEKKAKLTKDEALALSMGVDPNNHWKANYAIMDDKHKIRRAHV